MYFLRFLTVLVLVQLAFASTGQGIEPNDEKPSTQEVAESVKQEVFLKTANAEPIEIDRFKRFDTNPTAPVTSLRRTPELEEVTMAPRVGSGTRNEEFGIGRGSQPSTGIGSGTNAYGGGHNSGIGSGTSYGSHNPGIGNGTSHNYGIGSGTSHGSHNSGIGHGVKLGGKSPAIGSGTVDEIDEIGIGQGVQGTRRTPSIGSGVNKENFEIGEGTDSRGDRVTLDSDKDGVGTVLGGEVQIGRGVRARRHSQFDRFDTGFAKECNSYYGKIICYRIYTNRDLPTPSEYTCWRISDNRKNCTEVDNIVYLKAQGFKPDEYEIPSHNRHYPRQPPVETDQIVRGQDRNYDPLDASAPRSTHKFRTVSIGGQSSLELDTDAKPQNNYRGTKINRDDDDELYRQKRKRAVKTRKPYYIPPDYEIMDEYEQVQMKQKNRKAQQEKQRQEELQQQRNQEQQQ